MNSEYLKKIETAIDRTHSATTTLSERKELYRFIESEISDLSRCKELGYHFIRCDRDQHRLFGYHCVRKLVKQWTKLPDSVRNELRSLALTLFRFEFAAKHEIQNGSLLKEKISELMVGIATRSWADGQWLDVLPNLIKMAQQNPISLEMLFIVLRDLSFALGAGDYAMDSNPDDAQMPQHRKRIKDALTGSVSLSLCLFRSELSW